MAPLAPTLQVMPTDDAALQYDNLMAKGGGIKPAQSRSQAILLNLTAG